jgi:hypothetical protein
MNIASVAAVITVTVIQPARSLAGLHASLITSSLVSRINLMSGGEHAVQHRRPEQRDTALPKVVQRETATIRR